MMEEPEMSTTIEPAVKVETRRQPLPPRERLERIFQIEGLDALYGGKAAVKGVSLEVYKNLVYWSVVFAGMLRLNPPSPARRSWRASDNRVVGLPANITPTDSRYVVGIIGLWLRTQLEPIMHLRADEVMEFHEQLGEVFRLSARWPQRDRATWSKLPCPWCGGRLAIYPPEVRGAERMAVCEGCSRSLTQEEFDANVDRVATATKEAQKLVIKHGRNIPGEWRL